MPKTKNGYELTPYANIKAGFDLVWSRSFIGIDTASETPQGQVILNESTELQKLDISNKETYDSFDLDKAIDLNLDNLGKLIGLTRDAFVPAITVNTFTSSATGYTITAESRFVSNTDETLLYEVTSETIITSLTQSITLSAVGDSDAVVIGDTFRSLSNYPLLNNVEVTNFTAGVDKETNFDYRVNLKSVRTGNGLSGEERMQKAVLEVDGVSTAVALTKKQDGAIATGIMKVIVEGGDNTDIANTIIDQLDTGIITDGAITVPTLDYLGNLQDIKFSNPTPLIATFTLTYNLITGMTDSQKQEIIDGFILLCDRVKIGGKLYYQDVYGLVVSVITGTSSIATLTVNGGTVDITSTNLQKITADPTINFSNITVV